MTRNRFSILFASFAHRGGRKPHLRTITHTKPGHGRRLGHFHGMWQDARPDALV